MAIPRVKICCIRDREEAWTAIEAGASALGLVSEMPSGPGVISEDDIHRIAQSVPPGVGTFLLTSKRDPDQIVAQQRRCRVNTVQICDRIGSDALRKLRAELPGIALVQVVHVTGPEALDEALEADGLAHAVLLDSGNPNLAVKELGGTGRTHDWSLSRRIREALRVPLFLAGGLRPENVAEAARAVRPWGLDVCSGLRTADRLDQRKVAEFFAALAAC